tara:strand:+ start:843 stop:1121 length:279 start_codon:yes stop_codon:yes gene_type:complete
MKITKELIESMVREALGEAAEAAPEASAPEEQAANDVSRILTDQDMERINTNPEFAQALKKLVNHADFIPQGIQILANLYKQLPQQIRDLKK